MVSIGTVRKGKKEALATTSFDPTRDGVWCHVNSKWTATNAHAARLPRDHMDDERQMMHGKVHVVCRGRLDFKRKRRAPTNCG